jgi:hypothetical protein
VRSGAVLFFAPDGIRELPKKRIPFALVPRFFDRSETNRDFVQAHVATDDTKDQPILGSDKLEHGLAISNDELFHPD